MKRTVRLLSLLVAALLVITGCSTAEEAGETVTEDTAGVAVETETEIAPIEEETTEPAVEEETEAATDTTDAADAGDTGDTGDQTIAEIAATNPSFGTLLQALEAAGITETLEESGPFTLFAPNDDAFASLDQADLTALLADPTELGDILQYHVVEGSLASSDLSDGDELDTLLGEPLPVTIDGDTVMVGDATVVQPDIQAANGVIHIIDGVLQP